MTNIPTFKGGGNPASAQDFTSANREETIRKRWTFEAGLKASNLELPDGASLSDATGFVGITGNGMVGFTDSITGVLTLDGTDLVVEVDNLELVSRAASDLLIGTTSLAGFPVFAGNDAPAVASARLGKVDLTAQTADIASTALSNTPPAGLYEVEVYLETTTNDATAGTLAVVVGWTDDVGATTSTVIATHALTVTGRSTGRAIARLASGNLTYSVTATGIYGAAVYAVFVRVISLG